MPVTRAAQPPLPKDAKISFPQFASYGIAMEHLIQNGLGMTYVMPPRMTRRTLEVGARYAPDSVCAPFKLNLGCFLECIEQGADTLIQTGGTCRLGYYGELHEQILRDLGKDIRFVNFAACDFSNPKTFVDQFRQLKPDLDLKRFAVAALETVRMANAIDEVDALIRRRIGFAGDPRLLEQLRDSWLQQLRGASGLKQIEQLRKATVKTIEAQPIHMPRRPIRVGVVGEFFTVMDPFSNHEIERQLAGMGVLVDRWMDITNCMYHYRSRKLLPRIRGYAHYDMGATAMGTIDAALRYAKSGFDGIIHIKSAGCTPEIDAIPALQNISADYHIPILYLSYDTQTSEAGLQTRLEAFYDMISMRKAARKENKAAKPSEPRKPAAQRRA